MIKRTKEKVYCDVCNKDMKISNPIPMDICGDCYAKAKSLKNYIIIDTITKVIAYMLVCGGIGLVVGMLIGSQL